MITDTKLKFHRTLIFQQAIQKYITRFCSLKFYNLYMFKDVDIVRIFLRNRVLRLRQKYPLANFHD